MKKFLRTIKSANRDGYFAEVDEDDDRPKTSWYGPYPTPEYAQLEGKRIAAGEPSVIRDRVAFVGQ